jgi:hypothetical protein
MKVPDWEDCKCKDDEGIELTALEAFVYSQEPAGRGATEFRKGLQFVLDELEEIQ